MKAYDPDAPLIFIHVPKTAGTTVRQVFHVWFGEGLYYHYYNRETGERPERVRLEDTASGKVRRRICIYGHFNRERGFGLEDYYPRVGQFVTVLRDPFELMVSAYFYVRSQPASWGAREWIRDAPLEEFLERSGDSIFAPYFPLDMNVQNYREILERRFVHLGVTEDLDNSLAAMGRRLGFPPPGRVETLNRTERPHIHEADRLRQRFIDQHAFDYRVYAFARELNGKHRPVA